MNDESRPIYLDYNATTPIDPAVADAMIPFLRGGFGNPSSVHGYGVEAKRAVERARRQVARLVGAQAEEIVFTSGGSESNNMVLKGVAERDRDRGRHIVTTAVEHPAVIEPCRALERHGFRVTVLPVDEGGRVRVEDVERAFSADTILVSVMHANNEVGTIQPLEEISALARERGIPVHTDAAQSVGKIVVDVDALGVDFLTIAGHKLYGPKGVGALYIRGGHPLPLLIHGAGHEAGRRAGTENVLEIVGLGAAAELARHTLEAGGDHLEERRDRLWENLRRQAPAVRRNGDPDHCLPNTLSVSFVGVEASTVLAEIGDRVAASAGAACHAEGVDVSTVLEAMRVPLEVSMGTMRFSVGRETTDDDVDRAATIVLDAVTRLGSSSHASSAAVATEDVALTRFTHGMGCACKIRPQVLEQVLASLPASKNPAVLVDASTADDAAVYRVSDDVAIVQTVDFFTPITDDPEDFGAIAAANALSDLYAMGATPAFALGVVGFPVDRLPVEVLGRIMQGAVRKVAEAGIELVGGHSVEDTEPKFGLVATGLVHPDRVLTNAGARPGDRIVLTKPVGTGIIATAAKRGVAEAEDVARAIRVMGTLNRAAAEAARAVGVRAATDVTGFGLLGHLREMTRGSGVNVQLHVEAVPVLPGARDLAAADIVPGGTRDNLAYVEADVDWADARSHVDRLILADAQTSGGLLLAVPESSCDRLLDELTTRGVEGAVVATVLEAGEGRIRA